MKVKTAEATGLQLDWGVAVAETQSGAYHECGWDEADGVWVRHFGEEPTPFDHTEQAAARCVIAMKLGDEFECPDELGVMS